MFPAGVEVTFEEGLTIRSYAVIGGEVTGCIQVNGSPIGVKNGMVLFDSEDATWNGVLIQTDPSPVAAANWDVRMRGGNLIEYCIFRNVNDQGGGTAVTIDDAQVYVTGCLFDHDDTAPCGVQADGGLYWIRSNYFNDPNGGIICTGALDEKVDEDEAFLQKVINNNHIEGHFEAAIIVLGGWNGWVNNNIIENPNAGLNGIECNAAADAVIVNNTIVDCNQGIHVDAAPATVYNNILVDCTVGIDGADDEEFGYCLFSGNNQNVTDGVIDPLTCIFIDPDFVG